MKGSMYLQLNYFIGLLPVCRIWEILQPFLFSFYTLSCSVHVSIVFADVKFSRTNGSCLKFPFIPIRQEPNPQIFFFNNRKMNIYIYISFTHEMPRGKRVTPLGGLKFQLIQNLQQTIINLWRNSRTKKSSFRLRGVEIKGQLVKFVMQIPLVPSSG